MEEQLPSYQQATSTEDWLDLVAIYVDVHDYKNLCLVNKRFYAKFEPRLIRNPLAIGGQLTAVGDSDRERVWYHKFMTTCLQARLSTVSMITTLDFRAMSAVSASALNSPVSDITAHICGLSRALPNLLCLILDGRADFNMMRLNRFLGQLRDVQQPWKKIAILSLRDHPELGRPEVFHKHTLSGLVYLDLSFTRGWAQHLLYIDGFMHQMLPNLRVLKLSQMGLDSWTLGQVLVNFPFQFWSLDVSGNKLNDGFLRALCNQGVRCDVGSRLQHDGRFEVEGKLRRPDIADSVYMVDESDSSATFTHPLRYFADPPNFSTLDEEESRRRPEQPARLVGIERVRGDSVDDAIAVLAGGAHDPVPVAAEWPGRVPPPGGLTHFHMNGLEVSLKSIQGLLDSSSGYIEHFECDQSRFLLCSHGERWDWLSKAPWLSTGTILYGFPGSAYLLRPVISSNLRVLKIHHSLVTNVPTVISKSTSALENIWVAEKFFHGPIDLAYPQTYMPDMNPRLYSLTLAKLPRYSPGIVAKRIIGFLKLLAAQEQAIEQTKKFVPHRGPPVLRGLRHICLEFDPDTQEEIVSLNTDDDVDEAIDAFSSFSLSGSAWGTPPTPPETFQQPRRQSGGITSAISSSTRIVPAPFTTHQPQQIPTTKDGRLNVFPFNATETEHYPFTHATAATEDNNNNHPHHVLDVWIGNGILGAPNNTPAVNAYMRTLTLSDGRYASGVTPATPCHVVAGVPAGSYIFGDAWHRLALPEAAIERPTKAELVKSMHDVVQEIKAFRMASREVYARLVDEGKVSGGEVGQGQHDYWKGRVEISLVERKKKSGVMYEQ